MESSDLTLFVVDTPASPSVTPEKEKVNSTKDIYFLMSPTPFANYDPDTQSWRTFPGISLWGSELYSKNWPRSGMTLDGTAYQLPPCAPRTCAIEFSLSQHQGPKSHGLWPTATTADHATRFSQGGMPLGMAARLWPTPTHGKLSGGTGGMKQIEAKYLAGEITTEERQAMRAGNGGQLNPTFVEWLMGFPIGWTDLED